LFFYSYECQGIQTRNPFDEILTLSFDLRPLEVNTYGIKHESILQRIIKRTHIIKTHLMGEKKDKDLLPTLLKHSYLKISGILKLQKIKELSKIDPKF
jgi:hypothetical protein